MTAPTETDAQRDARGLMARAILSGIADLLWPWREIRRLRAEVARLDYRQNAWRTAYSAVHADHIAALDRLGDDAEPGYEMPGGLLGHSIPAAPFGWTNAEGGGGGGGGCGRTIQINDPHAHVSGSAIAASNPNIRST